MDWVNFSNKSTQGEYLPSDTDGSTMQKYDPLTIPSLGGGSNYQVDDSLARINTLRFSGYAYSTPGISTVSSSVPTYSELKPTVGSTPAFATYSAATSGVPGYPHGTYWPIVSSASAKFGNVTDITSGRGIYLLFGDFEWTQLNDNAGDGSFAAGDPAAQVILIRFAPSGIRAGMKQRVARYNNRVQFMAVVEIASGTPTNRSEFIQNFFTQGTTTTFAANCLKFSSICLYRYK